MIQGDKFPSDNVMNLANDNFDWLVNQARLVPSMFEKPETLLEHLKTVDAARLVRPTCREGNVVYCGVTQSQARRYLTDLTKMAEAAVQAGSRLTAQ